MIIADEELLVKVRRKIYFMRYNYPFISNYDRCCYCRKPLVKRNEICLVIDGRYFHLNCVPKLCKAIMQSYEKNKNRFIAEAI